MAGWLYPVFSAVFAGVSANQQNQAMSDATDAQIDAANASSDAVLNANQQSIDAQIAAYNDIIQRTQSDGYASDWAKSLLMGGQGANDADLQNFVDSSNTSRSTPLMTVNGLRPDLGGSTTRRTPSAANDPDVIQSGNAGIPSLSQSITGHDPSLLNAFTTGNISNKEWWKNGGPSGAAAVSQKIRDSIGIKDPISEFVFGDDGSKDARWGYASENAKKVDPNINWTEMARLHADAIAKSRQSKYMPGTQKGYDFDGDGQMSDEEMAAFEYYASPGNYTTGGGTGLVAYYEDGENPASSTQALKTQPYGTPIQANQAASTNQQDTGAPAGYQELDVPDWQEVYNQSGWKKAATEGLGEDALALSAAGAANGSLLSGSHWKALQDRSEQHATAGFGNWMSQNNILAGYSPTSTQNAATGRLADSISSSASSTGNALANAATQAGNAWATNSLNQRNVLADAVKGGVQGYGAQQGWFN